MVNHIPYILLSLSFLAGTEATASWGREATGPHTADPCDLPEAKGIRIMVKSNLLHDMLLTPDIGFEVGFTPHWSLSLQGVCAWWSNDSRHRYWRVAGGTAEARYWIVPANFSRTQKGHHVGIYCSAHCFDFEFGNTGHQSKGPVWGGGITYGYSIPLSRRLNLDLSASIGGSWGKALKYHPECGKYVCDSHLDIQRFGISDLGVTLVWYPGKGDSNTPKIKEPIP